MRSKHAVMIAALCSVTFAGCGYKKYQGDSAPLPPPGNDQQQEEQDQQLANFTRYCVNPESAEVTRTIEAVKALAKTDDCAAAQQFLDSQKALDLQGVNITDLRPLADLKSLQQLSLRANQLSSLEGLTGLTSLETLDVSRNNLPAGVSFNQFPALKNLVIEDSGVQDTAWLAPTCTLKSLILNRNELADFSGIAGCKQLETLALDATKMEDGDVATAGIAGLTELKALHVSGNQLTNVDVPAKLPKLEELKANGNKVTVIDSLSTAMGLKVIEMNGNKIGSLKPLQPLPNLTKVSFVANPVMKWSTDYPVNCPTEGNKSQALTDYCASYLQKHHAFLWHCLYVREKSDPRYHVVERIMNRIGVPVADCTDGYAELQSQPGSIKRNLNLSKALGKPALVNLEPLHDRVFAFIERLSVDNNQIKDLRPLAVWTGLKYLSASNNPLQVMPPLARLSNLKQLRLADMGLKKLTFIGGAASHPLQTLFVNGPNLESYAGVEVLSNLRNIQLGASPKIADLGPVATMAKLRSLNVMGNKQFGVFDLAGFPDLEYLGVVDQSDSENYLTDMALPKTLLHLDARFNAETNDSLNALPDRVPNLKTLNLFVNDGIDTLSGLQAPKNNKWKDMTRFCVERKAIKICPTSYVPFAVAKFCDGQEVELPGCKKTSEKADGLSGFEAYLLTLD